MIREKIVALQVLRFLACGGVIIHHALFLARSVGVPRSSLAWSHVSEIGAAGVDVFFVISGFVIARTGPLATPRPSSPQFLWRRWSRVAPLFFLISLFQISIGQPMEWTRTLTTLLFWPVYGNHITAPYVGTGWTLCIEMLFYVSVGAFLAIPRQKVGLVIGGIVIIGLLFLRLLVDSVALRYIANPVFLEFGAGVLLALGWSRLQKVPVNVGMILVVAVVGAFLAEAIVGSAGAAGASMFIHDGSEFVHVFVRVLVFGLPSTALVVGIVIVGRDWSGGIVRPFEFLGDASYSLYLTHPFVNAALATMMMGHHVQSWQVVSASIALAFSSGVFVYLAVERPLRTWLRAVRPWWSHAPSTELLQDGHPAQNA
ncbi:MAG: acyltransferase [Caulobacteraceae bacterium]|nr:acyltransferase [Caulobacteraceae bacterium]